MPVMAEERPVASGLSQPSGDEPYARPRMERALESRDASSGEQSRAWLAALRSEGAERDLAIARLHDLAKTLHDARHKLRRTLADAGLNSAVG
jgi:hypothetical protein